MLLKLARRLLIGAAVGLLVLTIYFVTGYTADRMGLFGRGDERYAGYEQYLGLGVIIFSSGFLISPIVNRMILKDRDPSGSESLIKSISLFLIEELSVLFGGATFFALYSILFHK